MSRLLLIGLVGLGGCFGSIGRYLLTGLAQKLMGEEFPYGTLAVNVIGCFIIGACTQLVEERQFFSPETRCLVMTGFLGGLTTFSTFGYETFAFLREGSWRMALCNGGANLAVGLAAVGLGWVTSRAIAGT